MKTLSPSTEDKVKKIVGDDDKFKAFYEKFLGRPYDGEYFLDVVTSCLVLELRVIKGLKQEELAKLIGTKQESIARAENYGVKSMKLLEKIGKACGYQLKVYFEEL